MRSTTGRLRLCLIGLLLLASNAAWAFSYDSVTFPSTPFTVPRHFLWIPLLFLLLFGVINTPVLKWLREEDGRVPLGSAVCAGIGVYLVCAISTWRFYPTHYSDYMVGSQVMWSVKWANIEPVFILMNLLALVVVLGITATLPHLRRDIFPFLIPISLVVAFGMHSLPVLFLCFDTGLFYHANGLLMPIFCLGALFLLLLYTVKSLRRFGAKKTLAYLGANAAVYLLCLTPFITTGAFAQGMVASSVCKGRMEHPLRFGLYEYFYAHEGRLPNARTIEELLTQFKQQTGMINTKYPDEFYTYCPSSRSFDRHPRAYVWNADLAGKTIDDLRKLPKPAPLLSCPYHARYGDDYIFTSDEIVAMYDQDIAYREKDAKWSKEK